MTAREKALENLDSLTQSLLDWRRYKASFSLKQMQKDRDVQNMILHALLLSIQACIDIAHHLIANLGLPRPGSYRESFSILASHGYLDEQTGEVLQDLAAFRNVLVHAYWRLDLQRVYELLQTRDKHIEVFLERAKHLLQPE